MLRSLGVLVALLACLHMVHLRLLGMLGPDGLPMGLGPEAKQAVRGPRAPVAADVLPSSAALRLLSLGYKNVVADYFWLRCISDYGDGRNVRDHYPNLLPLLRRVVALDPKFIAPYMFAGNVLTMADMPWREGLSLLEEGSHQRPDAWRLGLNLGINLYVLGQSQKKAALAVAGAAQVAGAPSYLASLASRLAAEAGEPEAGLRMIDTLLADQLDAQQQAALEQRRQKLLLEVHLKHLNQAARIFAAEHGHPVTCLQDLIGVADVQSIAEDPLGGAFFIDAAGHIATHHDAERLRVYHDKEPRRASH